MARSHWPHFIACNGDKISPGGRQIVACIGDILSPTTFSCQQAQALHGDKNSTVTKCRRVKGRQFIARPGDILLPV